MGAQIPAAPLLEARAIVKRFGGIEALRGANFSIAPAEVGTTPMGAGGRFVFVSSSSSHAPQPGRSAYSASKAGLNAFAAAFAGEV